MSKTLAAASMEIKRCGNYKTLIPFLILLLITLLSTNSGIDKYKRSVIGNGEFQSVEKEFFENVRNYFDYSKFGFRVKTAPSPAMAIHSAVSIMMGMSGRINSVILLDLLINAKRMDLENGNSPFQFHLSPLMQ
ncbi:MAG: hypothetical protein GY950_08485, partial [bacterium]|nr:hypothetical protein [bacterium]